MIKKRVCPACGSKDVIPIIYGEPSYDLEMEAAQGKFKLGGCLVYEGIPDNYCKTCNYEWNVERLKSEVISDYAELIEIIDRAIKEAWLYDIKSDYFRSFLLYEDSLKNALYHAVTNRLGLEFLIANRIRVFTEFHDGALAKHHQRADIAIIKLKEPIDDHLSNCIEDIYALIELKYKNASAGVDCFLNDVDKVKQYINNKHLERCQFYIGFIHETSYSPKEISWLQKRQQNAWAKGRLSELIASSFDVNADIEFMVLAQNDMNNGLSNNHDKIKSLGGFD